LLSTFTYIHHQIKTQKAVVDRGVNNNNRDHQTLSHNTPKHDNQTPSQRHQYLDSKGWIVGLGTDNTKLRISPQRKIKFIQTWAATVFEDIRQKCNGDENKASELFVEQMKGQGFTIAKLVVGGIRELYSHKAAEVIPVGSKTGRHSALESSGWTFERSDTSTHNLLKLSPNRKLRFASLNAAESFERCRQECNGDENKASELFVKQMKKQGIPIAEVMLGGIRELNSYKNAEEIHLGHQAPRHIVLKSSGWTIERNGTHLLKVSPIRKLQFNLTWAAEAFEDLRQQCDGDEYIASTLFVERMKEQNPNVQFGKLIIGGIRALSFDAATETKIPGKTNKTTERHQALVSKGWEIKRDQPNITLKVSPDGIEFKSLEAAEFYQYACKACKGDLSKAAQRFLKQMNRQGKKISKLVNGGTAAFASVETKPSQTQISKTPEPRINSCLAELSSGWVTVNYKCSSKDELHFESPLQKVRFKSFRGAKLFDSVLKHSSNELEAIETFINEHGHDRVRGMVCNYGKIRRELKGNMETIDVVMDQDSSDDISPIDDDYYEVDNIQEVRFDKGQMQCLVRWQGLSKDADTWEPSENLCDSASELLHVVRLHLLLY
jgi:hypothetical protein